MKSHNEDDIYIKQGETLKIQIVVRQPGGSEMSLLGAQAKMVYVVDGVDIIKSCDIIQSTVIAILNTEETINLTSNYKYEIILLLANGEVKSLADGILIFKNSFVNKVVTVGGE